MAENSRHETIEQVTFQEQQAWKQRQRQSEQQPAPE
jgi:hypothetical protein